VLGCLALLFSYWPYYDVPLTPIRANAHRRALPVPWCGRAEAAAQHSPSHPEGGRGHRHLEPHRGGRRVSRSSSRTRGRGACPEPRRGGRRVSRSSSRTRGCTCSRWSMRAY
jgi:hypothetical protein